MTGVSCYSSTDLLKWKNEGNVLPAVNDPASDLHPAKVLERPKVIYNAKTKKFVMWFHADSMNYAAARCGVAVSDTPAGPFKYLRSFRPDAGAWPINATEEEKANPKLPFVRDHEVGQMARDMLLARLTSVVSFHSTESAFGFTPAVHDIIRYSFVVLLLKSKIRPQFCTEFWVAHSSIVTGVIFPWIRFAPRST